MMRKATIFSAAAALFLTASMSAAATAAKLDAAPPVGEIVGMRRLTELQYRNAIADIFGADITVAGRFEPIVRPTHQLIATGSSSSAISPAGLEQFDAMARNIAAQVFDEAHRPTFVPCQPKDIKKPDADCARKTLLPIGRYVLRRPLTAREQTLYVQMASSATTQDSSFYSGLELALAAMLVAPDFLYIIESAEPDPAHPGELRLDNYSRASRLSFLLWNTTPNEALLNAAAQGRLINDTQLAAVAEKMVASPRFENGVRAFFVDMLLFEKFDEIAKDPVIYPRFNQTVAKDLPEQMLRTIVDQLVTRNGDYRDLFTTRHTFLTRALGPLYNAPVHSANGWEAYDIPAEDERAGLLGQAGFLALYSHSGRSSPTLRGRAIRELLLCQPVPNPPGNVNFTVVQDTSNKVLRTARARLTAHATDPACSACHKITDPIGLPLENFDGIGAFRKQENETDIDVAGLFEGEHFNGAVGLGKAIAASPSTTECVAGRAWEYATGHALADDSTQAMTLDKSFAANGYRISSLFARVATSPDAYRFPATSEKTAPAQLTMATADQAGNGGSK
jgi:hypothetical protein